MPPKRLPIFAVLPLLLVAGCDGANDPGAENVTANGAVPAAPAPAPPADPAEPGRPDEEVLIQLERDYARALIERDRDFLMRFYAADWRGGNWMGFWTKATMLKSVLDERYVIRSMELHDIKVRVLGDVAIVQGVDDEITAVDGRDTSGRWAFTDVFERRDGRWVAVASHTSEVKPNRP